MFPTLKAHCVDSATKYPICLFAVSLAYVKLRLRVWPAIIFIVLGVIAETVNAADRGEIYSNIAATANKATPKKKRMQPPCFFNHFHSPAHAVFCR